MGLNPWAFLPTLFVLPFYNVVTHYSFSSYFIPNVAHSGVLWLRAQNYIFGRPSAFSYIQLVSMALDTPIGALIVVSLHFEPKSSFAKINRESG